MGPPDGLIAAPAVIAQRSKGDKLPIGERVTRAMRREDHRYALSYRDPTGEAAIRSEARRIRDLLGWEPRTVNKLVMGPSKLPIHISDDLCELLFIFLATEANVKPTNSGKGLRADIKKKTPVADSNANPSRDEGQSK